MAKVAVLICRSCDIEASLDLPALEKMAAKCDGVCHVRSAPSLCGDGGPAVVRESLAAGADGLLIAACAARFHVRAFASADCHVERVSLRELVVASHEPKHEDTQMLAEDVLRMGVVRATRVEHAQPETLPAQQTVLIVGGGPAGMAAALGVARAGHKVVLVEKEADLGGWLRVWKRTLPSHAPYRELEPSVLEQRRKDVNEHPNIQVHCGALVRHVSGQPGRFEVTLRVGGQDLTTQVGAIVQATGFAPYDASKLSYLGYGRSPDVVTNVELEGMLASGQVRRPSDGQRPARIVFIQCAGSRDPRHLAYCSSVCCRVTLKQALWLRELDPGCETFVIARELRSPGLHEDFYRRAQEDQGIHICKGEVVAVEPAPPCVLVTLGRSQLGEGVELEADLVVLATGMVPVAADGPALRQLADARKNLARGDGNAVALQETIDRLCGLEGSEILGLSYRQGPDLPTLEAGFPDSHFTCFPYETRRTGIYAAGCVRAPGDLETSRIDGEGAALKAIQSILHVALGEAVHPRWGDLSPPTFNLQRCTQCKRCTEECPFGTLDEDERCTPKLNPGRCRRCGICMGACPERLISYADYSVDLVSRMIKSIEVPGEFDEKPRVLLFLCENDAYPALELAGFQRQRWSPFVRAIPVRCLGAVNVVWLADAFARGFDGVLLLGCKPGEHTQCHYIHGSELLATRSENIRQRLKQMALEDQRVRVDYVTVADSLVVPTLIDDFVKHVASLGPNPFKDS